MHTADLELLKLFRLHEESLLDKEPAQRKAESKDSETQVSDNLGK